MTRRVRNIAVLAASVALLAGAARAAAQPSPGPGPGAAPPASSAVFKDAAGREVGQAVLREGPSGVLVELSLRGVPPGWHGVHFHAVGDCSDPKFEHAGAHINAMAKRPHGLLNPNGPDFGDLPNVHVGGDGTAQAELYAPLVSLTGAQGRAALRDADGSALVLHAGRDDQATQPIGGAGARLACAVIR